MYIPVVTLSTQNDKTLLEQLRTGFKITIKWNIYRSEMTNQAKNNNSFKYLLKMRTVEHLFLSIMYQT